MHAQARRQLFESLFPLQCPWYERDIFSRCIFCHNFLWLRAIYMSCCIHSLSFVGSFRGISQVSITRCRQLKNVIGFLSQIIINILRSCHIFYWNKINQRDIFVCSLGINKLSHEHNLSFCLINLQRP